MCEKDINICDITPIIPNDLFKLVTTEMNSILKKICDDNNLNHDLILEKYSDNI